MFSSLVNVVILKKQIFCPGQKHLFCYLASTANKQQLAVDNDNIYYKEKH